MICPDANTLFAAFKVWADADPERALAHLRLFADGSGSLVAVDSWPGENERLLLDFNSLHDGAQQMRNVDLCIRVRGGAA